MPLDLDPRDVAPEAHTIEPSEATNRLKIIDGDIHTAPASLATFKPFLERAWFDHLTTYGSRRRHGLNLEPYPKSCPRAMRRDVWPDDGAMPGSDLGLLQSQHLDLYGIECGIMGPLGMTGQGEINPGLSAAMARGINRWQRDVMAMPEPRLKASIVVPYEDAEASVAEIETHGADHHFAQVFFLTRSQEPLGARRYWPIYAAAERFGLPVAFHVFGAGGHPYTGTGWPSYYIEEGAGHSTSCQTVVTSLVIEGVFERFPKLKTIIVEGGFGWLPALSWRLDKLYERMRSEVPHLKRKPSDYIRDHIWLSTQPMEEPDNRRHLNDIIDWIGADRLVFASDYPHWDFDDPFRAFPAGIPEATKRTIMTSSGLGLYRL